MTGRGRLLGAGAVVLLIFAGGAAYAVHKMGETAPYPARFGDQSAPRLVVFGHSYTVGGGLGSDLADSWPRLVAAHSCRGMLNWGHGGDVLAQTSAIVAQHADSVRPQDVAVIQIGLNDLRRNGRDRRALATFGRTFRLMLRRLAGRRTVVVGAEPIRAWRADPPFDHGSPAALAAYNTVERSAAARAGDAFVPSPAGWSTATDLASDGIHPDAAGHAAIAHAVEAADPQLARCCRSGLEQHVGHEAGVTERPGGDGCR